MVREKYTPGMTPYSFGPFGAPRLIPFVSDRWPWDRTVYFRQVQNASTAPPLENMGTPGIQSASGRLLALIQRNARDSHQQEQPSSSSMPGPLSVDPAILSCGPPLPHGSYLPGPLESVTQGHGYCVHPRLAWLDQQSPWLSPLAEIVSAFQNGEPLFGDPFDLIVLDPQGYEFQGQGYAYSQLPLPHVPYQSHSSLPLAPYGQPSDTFPPAGVHESTHQAKVPAQTPFRQEKAEGKTRRYNLLPGKYCVRKTELWQIITFERLSMPGPYHIPKNYILAAAGFPVSPGADLTSAAIWESTQTILEQEEPDIKKRCIDDPEMMKKYAQNMVERRLKRESQKDEKRRPQHEHKEKTV